MKWRPSRTCFSNCKMAAAHEQPELAESIGRAARANPPEEVEESMRRNAVAIGEGRSHSGRPVGQLMPPGSSMRWL